MIVYVDFRMLGNRSNAAGKCPLQSRVTINRVRQDFSPNIWVDPKKWNTSRKEMDGTSRDSKETNELIAKVRQKLIKLREDLEQRGEEITSKKLIEYYKGTWSPVKVPTVLELFAQQMEFMHKSGDKKKAGFGGYAEGYIETFAAAQNHLKNFIRVQFKVPDVGMDKIEEDFLDRFEEYLLADTDVNGKNTAVKYCAIVKRIIKRGRGYLKKPVEYVGRKEKTFAAFLTLEELIRMESKEISIERLDNIRRRYIFSCFTGYAFSDQDGLRTHHIVTDEDGRKWILDKNRQKSGEPAKVPLLPPALRVIEHFKNHSEMRGTDRLFPTLSNQKMNAYLKEIAVICDIHKTLTTHTGRYTFATTVSYKYGLDLQETAKVMGHATTKQTQMYRKMMHEHLKETLEANKAFDRDILKH